VVGGPGSGKTIFGNQFIFKGATAYGEPGIYVTMEEPPYSIANNMKEFNWDLYRLEIQGKIAFVDASPIRGDAPGRYVLKTRLGSEKFDLDGVVSLISEAKKQIKAKRCVVDSLSAMFLKYKDKFEMRQQFFTLVRALTEMGLTTLLLTEMRQERRDVQTFGIESFLSQGAIVLHMFRVEDVLVRAIEIRKMRGVKHSEKLSLYRITSDGIAVYPNETVFGIS